MGQRLIFDTTALIDFERGRLDRETFADDDIAIAAVSVAEFKVGVELARTDRQRAARQRVLADVLEAVGVLDYGTATALSHASLLASARRSGTPCGAHDLIIAAHAIEHDRIVVGRDAGARFGDLPGVRTLD